MEKKPIPRMLLLAVPIVAYCGFNFQYLYLSFSLLLGLIVLPYAVRMEGRTGGFRYAIIAGVAALLYQLHASNSLYFFSAIFLLLFVLDNWWGRLNYLPGLLALIISPLIGNLAYVWSFPIRLQLSKMAATVLQWIKMDIQVDGNMLLLDGESFSVDPACIGLKMIVTALVLGVLILAYFEKKYQAKLAIWKALLFLCGVFLSTILANFTRLLLLIIFQILPENPLHDVAGLLSLGLYTLLPMYLLANYLFKKQGVSTVIENRDLIPGKGQWFSYGILLVLLIFNGIQRQGTPVEAAETVLELELPGFSKTITPNGVLKLQNEQALVYIKPPVRFFQGSHDPRFCWQGSGYRFSKIRKEQLAGKDIYTAVLQKDSDELHTAWWYENGEEQTTNEWDWRWADLQGKKGFYLLNISSTGREELENLVEDLSLGLLVE